MNRMVVDAMRERTYRWEAPQAAADFSGLSGLELLRRVIEGKFTRAPMAATLDFDLVEVEQGRAVFEGVPAEHLYNPLGTVHGGFAATMLDSCMGCAVHSALAAGQGYTTLELKVNLVRPLFADSGRVRAEGKLIHLGGRTATAEGRLVGCDDGKLYAHGTTTCLVFPISS
jgi:uncharacterized protein (TIGR00369 family)